MTPGPTRRITLALLCGALALASAACGESPIGSWELDRQSAMPDTSSMPHGEHAASFERSFERLIPEITVTIEGDGTFTWVEKRSGRSEAEAVTSTGTWTLDEDGVLTLDPDAEGRPDGRFRFEGDELVQMNGARGGGRDAAPSVIYRRAD
jgi:hypothetical protein